MAVMQVTNPSPDIIKLRRDFAATWVATNKYLQPGEPGVERDTKKFKIGPGNWNDLPYYINEDHVFLMIEEAIADLEFQENGGALEAHIADETPHPAYDDMEDLVVLYQNKKV